MGAFIACDAFSKSLVTVFGLPVLQMLALRSFGMLAVLSCIAVVSLDKVGVSRRDFWLLSVRVVLEAFGSWLFSEALVHLPMSNATAIVNSLPLAVMIGAALVLREPIGLAGWLVALGGFVGVLIIVRPTAAGIGTWSLCALASVLCMATRDLSTRSLGSRVPSVVVALVGSAGLFAFSAGSAWAQAELPQWRPLGWSEMLVVVGAATTASGGFLSSVLLMRSGSVAFVQPFRYTLLLWATLIGWLVFAEVPDAPTIVGSLILVAAGVIGVRLEQARAAAAVAVEKGDATVLV